MIKQEAIKYHELGWNLIPIRTDNKNPATAWSKYQTERQDLEFVNKWFGLNSINIAIITGAISGIVVVDIDPQHGADTATYLSKYNTGVIASTPSGGVHLFFKHPGVPVTNKVGVFAGVDVRGDGGFVHAAPSEYAKGKYEWMTFDLGLLGDLPKEFYSETATGEHERANPEDWISTLLEYGAKTGERNKSLSSLTGFFAAKDMPKDVTLQLLKTWNNKNAEKIPLKELESSVESVYKTINRKTGGRLKARSSSTDAPTHGGKDFNLMLLDDFMVKYGDDPVDWIIKDWLPDNTIGFVVSPPGSYKTWTLIDLCVSVASGKPFLGMHQVLKPGPVFLVQQEDYAGQTAQRITLVRRSKYKDEELPAIDDDGNVSGSIPDRIPLYIHPDRRLKLDDKKAMDDLEKAIIELQPKLIVLDPLYSLGGTDDYMASLVEDLFIFKEFRDKYGVSFVVAHHTNKGNATDRTRAWGSQFLNAFLETGWQIEPKGDKSIKIKRHFKASQNIEEISLSFNIDDREAFSYEVCEGLLSGNAKDDSSNSKESDKKKDHDSPAKSVKRKEADKILDTVYSKDIDHEKRLMLFIRDFKDSEVIVPDYTLTKESFSRGGSQVKSIIVDVTGNEEDRGNLDLLWHPVDVYALIHKAGKAGVDEKSIATIINRSIKVVRDRIAVLKELNLVEVATTISVGYTPTHFYKTTKVIPHGLLGLNPYDAKS